MTQTSIYPTYTRPERIADFAVHLLAIAASLIGSALLIRANATASTPMHLAIWVYCIVLCASFVASLVYNFAPNEQIRPTLRRIDHAAIYFSIAGPFTPLTLVIGTPAAYTVLALVWIIATLGAIWKLFFWSSPRSLSLFSYLALGSLGLTLAWPFIQAVPAMASTLAGCGGLTYAAGTLFYRAKSLKFSRAIWHTFVLIAAACFFVAIWLATVVQS